MSDTGKLAWEVAAENRIEVEINGKRAFTSKANFKKMKGLKGISVKAVKGPAEDKSLKRDDLKDKNVAELQELARRADISGRSNMNKKQLIAALKEEAK